MTQNKPLAVNVPGPGKRYAIVPQIRAEFVFTREELKDYFGPLESARDIPTYRDAWPLIASAITLSIATFNILSNKTPLLGADYMWGAWVLGSAAISFGAKGVSNLIRAWKRRSERDITIDEILDEIEEGSEFIELDS